MKKEELRERLIHELWRMYKMDIIAHLIEFVEGETAVLAYLAERDGQSVNPSNISDELRVSRARTANILRSLRQKGMVDMAIADDDRRKMLVRLTDEGRRQFREKFRFVSDYFDLYIDVLGEEDISELTRLLKKTVDSEDTLRHKKLLPGGEHDR